jgi:hypothetical protein
MFQIANATGYALDHGCEPVFENFKWTAAAELNYQYVFYRLNILPSNHNLIFKLCQQIGDQITSYGPLPCEPNENLRFNGYFVNEKYFVRHREHIRQLFAPSEEILSLIHAKFHDLLEVPTVAVHVRTYIRDGQNPEYIGHAGSWDYFIKAMDYFSDDYTFLVFSDNPEWTKAHFPANRKKIKFIEGNPHYIDFYLMSLCHHQIIACSTFSWWAAWLNPNLDKVVIAPYIFYNRTAEDVLPPEWIRVASEPFSKDRRYCN